MIPVRMMKLIRRFTALACCGVLCAMGLAEEPGASERPASDTLVYKDGDRLRGHLVEQSGQTIVFQSERFGLLRVPLENAVVIRSGQAAEISSVSPASSQPKPSLAVDAPHVPSAQPASPAGNLQVAAERTEPVKGNGGEWYSPALLASRLANLFGQWHGKLGFGAEVLTNTTDQEKLSLEGVLQRKWKDDEVVLKSRYDYIETNKVTTTDLLKADGLWRHDFQKSRFALYRPTFEWNRASFSKAGLPTDYISIQQEIGGGLNVFSTKTRTVRFGLSENIFDTWNLAPIDGHTSFTSESAFLETEFKLPWRTALVQRGVYYYSVASATDGWEYRIELSKKFSETLVTSVSYEIRRGSPRNGAPDYARLKLLFGFDF